MVTTISSPFSLRIPPTRQNPQSRYRRHGLKTNCPSVKGLKTSRRWVPAVYRTIREPSPTSTHLVLLMKLATLLPEPLLRASTQKVMQDHRKSRRHRLPRTVYPVLHRSH